MYARLSFQHWQWLIVGSRGLKIGCEQRGYISTGCISDLRKIQLPQGFCAMKLRGIPYECSLADVRSFITSFGLRPSAVVMETCADTGASYSLEQSGTFTGYAVIVFEKPIDGEGVGKLHDQQLGSRYIEGLAYQS